MTAGPSKRPGATGRIAVAVAVLAAAAGLWFGADWSGRPGVGPAVPVLQAGTALSQPKPLTPFVLTDQDGGEMTERGLRGTWTFAAIGYTTCPDICPMTMATFVALQKQIAAAGSGLGPRFMFISVDPGRDTPERLAQYVRHFDPGFRGATGPDEVLRALARDLGGLYARVEDPKSALGYTMDHSASIYLIDPQGRLAAIFSTPHDTTMMARDFAALSGAAVPQSQPQKPNGG
jgi:protein SCO1/2